MFDQFMGLPLHVLILHATVVFVPLTTLLAVAYAIVPRWRWAVRWPMLVAAVVSLPTAYVTAQSGQALLARRPELAPLVEVHGDRGRLLVWLLLGQVVIAALAFFALGGPSPLVGGRSRTGAVAPVQIVVAVLLVIVAVWCLVQVVLTGDAGARAVWQ